jgi:hypothetical protein
MTANFCTLATDAVVKTANAYRIAREIVPSLEARDLAVRTVALARIARYAILLARCDGEVTAEMKKPVAAIIALLQRDFAPLDKPGLSHLVHLEYDALIAGWQRLFQKYGGGLSPEEDRAGVQIIATMVLSQQLADQAIAAAAQSLAALAAAHTALLTEVIQ